jgi:hypothetical protein
MYIHFDKFKIVLIEKNSLLRLFLPQTKGAQKLYVGFLRPTLLNYERDIDSRLNKIKSNF